jgi:CDP-glycerol glycerophosphotransferase
LRALIREGLRFGLAFPNRVVPKIPGRVLLVGSPPEEGNVVEIARALHTDSTKTILWVDRPALKYLYELGFDNPDCIRTLPGSRYVRLSGHFLRAQSIYFTHGLLGMPSAARDQVIVNLWHGEGPKGGGPLFPTRRGSTKSSSFLVGGCRSLARMMTDLAGLEESQYLWSGYPRTDQFARSTRSSALLELGLDPDLPFVVWLPTYRRARKRNGGLAWSNTADPHGDESLSDRMTTVVKGLRARGIVVAVKPHPMDFASRRVGGAVYVTDEALYRCGTGLFQFIGSSSGLISDYSAVWVDYLCTDKPIGFFMPDEKEFRKGRGSRPAAFDFPLPGTVIDDSPSVDRFSADVFSSGKFTADLRAQARQRLQLRDVGGAAIRVVDAVHGAQAARGKRSDGLETGYDPNVGDRT